MALTAQSVIAGRELGTRKQFVIAIVDHVTIPIEIPSSHFAQFAVVGIAVVTSVEVGVSAMVVRKQMENNLPNL